MDDYPLPPRLLDILQDMPLGQLAFRPVPLKLRRDGWTPRRQQAFILRLALCGSVAKAAQGVGMGRESAYRLRRHPGAASFAASWDRAVGWGQDRMLDMAMERAIVGELRPVFRRGELVGEYMRHDNRLAMSVLKALDRRADRRDERGGVDLQHGK